LAFSNRKSLQAAISFWLRLGGALAVCSKEKGFVEFS
jgi:hypothetical protein